MSIHVSASLSCANILNLGQALEELNNSSIDFIHYDVVDGRFNDCFVLGDLVLEKIRPLTHLPIEVHLAVMDPEVYIKPFIKAGADAIAIHREVISDASLLHTIRELGAKPILAYRADTAPNSDDIELLKHVDGVLKLTVNPGYAGQPIQQQALDHIASLAQLLNDHNLSLPIQADGNMNVNTVKRAVDAGATIVTGGTSGLFLPGTTLNDNINKLKESV